VIVADVYTLLEKSLTSETSMEPYNKFVPRFELFVKMFVALPSADTTEVAVTAQYNKISASELGFNLQNNVVPCKPSVLMLRG